MANKKVDWQKISVYIAALIGFMTIIFYIIDMKVDIATLKSDFGHEKRLAAIEEKIK